MNGRAIVHTILRQTLGKGETIFPIEMKRTGEAGAVGMVESFDEPPM